MGGAIDIVKYLVECGVELEQRDDDGKTALMIAKKGGYTEIVEILKSAGAKDRVVKKPVKQKMTKVKKVKSSKIHLIAAIKDNKIVEAFHLIEAGHDVWDYDEESYSVFDYACKGGHLDLIKKMVEHGYKVDDLDFSHSCSDTDNLEIIKYLVSLGLDVNARDEEQCCPLHLLEGQTNPEIVKYLVSCGADIESKGSDGVYL